MISFFALHFLFILCVQYSSAQNEGPIFGYNPVPANQPPRSEASDWLAPPKVGNSNSDVDINTILRGQVAESTKLGPAHSCDDLYSQGVRRDGQQYILIDDVPTEVYCEFNTSSDNWLVFQNRYDGSVDFYRPFQQYEDGFGELTGEFWLGLKTLHKITHYAPYRLRIELEDFFGERVHIDYSTFAVADPQSGYLLTVRGFNGPKYVGDAFSRQHRSQFSAFNEDHDKWNGNCAVERHGGWWYNRCSLSNLNGRYVNSGKRDKEGIMWFYWKRTTRSLKSTRMKIQPVNPFK